MQILQNKSNILFSTVSVKIEDILHLKDERKNSSTNIGGYVICLGPKQTLQLNSIVRPILFLTQADDENFAMAR